MSVLLDEIYFWSFKLSLHFKQAHKLNCVIAACYITVYEPLLHNFSWMLDWKTNPRPSDRLWCNYWIRLLFVSPFTQFNASINFEMRHSGSIRKLRWPGWTGWSGWHGQVIKWGRASVQCHNVANQPSLVLVNKALSLLEDSPYNLFNISEDLSTTQIHIQK